MSRDTNQNLYAEEIINESPYYYDEHGRLRVRILEGDVPPSKEDDEESKLRAEGLIGPAVMVRDPRNPGNRISWHEAQRIKQDGDLTPVPEKKPELTPVPEKKPELTPVPEKKPGDTFDSIKPIGPRIGQPIRGGIGQPIRGGIGQPIRRRGPAPMPRIIPDDDLRDSTQPVRREPQMGRVIPDDEDSKPPPGMEKNPNYVDRFSDGKIGTMDMRPSDERFRPIQKTDKPDPSPPRDKENIPPTQGSDKTSPGIEKKPGLSREDRLAKIKQDSAARIDSIRKELQDLKKTDPKAYKARIDKAMEGFRRRRGKGGFFSRRRPGIGTGGVRRM